MADKIVVTPKGRRLSVPDDADAETVASLIDQTDALPDPVKPEGALSRFGSALWEGVNPVNAVKSVLKMGSDIPGTIRNMESTGIAHGIKALDAAGKAIAPRPNQPYGLDNVLDRASAAGEAFRQGVGALLPGTAERGDRLIKGDVAGALGDQTAFTANLLAPEVGSTALRVIAPESRAVSMVQNARKIQDPNAAKFLLEQNAAGGSYSKLQQVADAANARTTTRSVPAEPLATPLVDQYGKPLAVTGTVQSAVKDPAAWRAYYGLKQSLDRPTESALGREGTAAYLGQTLGGPKAEAAAVGATALTRTAPRAKIAQVLYNATQGGGYPKIAAALRAALLAQFTDPSRGGS